MRIGPRREHKVVLHVPVASIEADVNARIQPGIADGPEVLHIRDRIISFPAKIIAACDQLLAGRNFRRRGVLKLNAERSGARHGHREPLIGKEQKSFTAAGQVLDLRRCLAAVDFKGERKADRRGRAGAACPKQSTALTNK